MMADPTKACRLSCLALAGAFAAAGGGTASAQVIDEYFVPTGAAVGGTPSDPSRGQALSRYNTDGVRAGSFVIRPDLTEGFGYNSNVEGFRGGRDSPFFLTTGSVQASSDWGRNSAYAAAAVADTRYLSLPHQDFTNWTAAVGGTLDVGRDTIGASYTHLNLSQTPGSIDAVTVAQPVSFRVDALQLSYTARSFGRFTFIPEVDVTKYDFSDYTQDNQTISQAYRNRVVVQGSVTTRYELAPMRDLLLVVRGTHISYLDNVAGLPRRDSNGGAVLAGIDYPTPGANLRFRVLAGVQARAYVSCAYSTLVEPIVEASVTYTPTRLTSLTLLARRDIEDASDESIAGYSYTTGRLSVDHELRRNVLLHAYAQVELADFQSAKVPITTPGLQEAGTSQVIYGAGASATWLLNRDLRASVSYGLSDRQGSQSSGNYLSSIGMLTIGFRL